MNQQELEIKELTYLDAMGEKAGELLNQAFQGNSYPVSTETPFPIELMENGARILIDVAAVNTPIRGFHVLPVVEEHLYLLNVQDKNKNTVADVVFITAKQEDAIEIQDILVTYKAGAIMYCYEQAMSAEKALEEVE